MHMALQCQLLLDGAAFLGCLAMSLNSLSMFVCFANQQQWGLQQTREKSQDKTPAFGISDA
jgi:hypothetical protein